MWELLLNMLWMQSNILKHVILSILVYAVSSSTGILKFTCHIFVMMANYLASNDFTFVHPSATHLTGAPSTSVGYNLDFHGPQNVFSPINCTLPTTIQFPTPPVTSLPQNGGGSGSYLAEPANGTASSYNYACVTWQPPVNMNPLLSTCTEVSLPFVPQVSTPMPNGGFGTTSLW